MIDSQVSNQVPPLRGLIEEELQRIRVLKGRLPATAHADLLRRAELAIRNADCPSCAEAQADGIPCLSETAACDECARALEWIRALRVEMENAFLSDPWEI